MPPREHDVFLFQLGGRRQNDVGVSGRVGQEVFADHREQVVALQALLKFGLLGHHGHGVGVVDEQRLDRRVEAEFAGQRRPKPP